MSKKDKYAEIEKYNSYKVFLKLIPYIKPYKKRLLWAGVFMLLTAAVNAGGVYLLKPIIDGVAKISTHKDLLLLILIIPVVYFFKSAFSYTNGYLISYVGQRLVQKLRMDVFKHLHKLSMEFYWRKRTGEILTKAMSDVGIIQTLIGEIPVFLLRDLFTTLGVVFVLFYTNAKFALVLLVIGPLAGLILSLLGKKMKKATFRAQLITQNIFHRFTEAVEGMSIIKAFNYEKLSIKHFKQDNEDIFSETMRLTRATILASPLMELLGSLMLVILLYFGGRNVLDGTMTIGEFGVFCGAFFMIYRPLKNISRLYSKIQIANVSWSRIVELLDEKPEVVDPKKPKVLKNFKGGITFKNVSYKYPKAHDDVLKNINLEVKPNESIAFVGPSGSGKTTIINILLRLFDPQKGQILFDGVNIKDITEENLRDQMGLVSQHTILFDDTIENNIRVGKPKATLEEVKQASETADALEFIEKKPQEFQTLIGERGVKVSGGQKQRLAIARAIIKQPHILLLDEATSSLDSRSEKNVQQSIEKLLGTRTMIMVAHRLSTITHADKICVLQNGEIAELGSHTELIAKDGIYKKLYDIQNSGVNSERIN